MTDRAAVEVVDLVLQNPVLTTTRIAQALQTSLQSALNHVRRLEADGIVSEVTGLPGRSKRWVCLEVFNVLEPNTKPTFSDQDRP
ncbi:MAG: winged helix-turn-helix domain-containing protein [Acidimicrobiales bacterium]